ncbi:hypothetical protein [Caldimonas brevitalea]|uniref:Uncharacterized protein n=1 Tax=Caldimonas brevitalea TaxID=413882 RepID=A0A0G3BMR4_9BURK|nr:hypothetical protein [Caldimonas brevitalea]AKJ27800.1 hypothetical protein AAW51_1109 [Caldimonas brevitalea]
MAVIRLQVEIDSDVYPELYAGLAAIARSSTQEERLRQLAASGLVWEAVRMRGPAVVTAPGAAVPVKKGSSRPAQGLAAPEPEVRAATAPAGVTRSRTPAPELPGASGRRRAVPPAPEALDLVLDDVTAPATVPHLRPPGPQGVPVLLDVVDETTAGGPAAAPDGGAKAAPEPPRAADDAAADPYPPPLDTGIQQRPAPRSARLKRMADRGLFKNG